MMMRPNAMKFSARVLTMGLLLASSSAFAQDVAPAAPVAPTTLPPVEAVEPVAPPSVAPPPVVRTLPNSSDTVSPQAAAEVAQERAERAPRAPVATAPAPRPAATGATVSPTQAPVTTDTAEQADPNISETAASAEIAPIVPVDAPAVAAAPADVAPIDASGDNDWLIGTGIAAALGLAGIAFLATRRRRQPGDVVTKAAPPTFVEQPRDVVRPAERPLAGPAVAPSFAAGSVDPLFSRPRHDIPVAATGIERPRDMEGVTDPLFAHRPAQAQVTDPMFARKIEVPPITDPMFARHPDYAGHGPVPKPQSNGSTERARELEPAE